MRTLPLLAAALAVAAVSSPVVAQDPPDFTGRWKWDQSQSSGMASGAPQIAQTRATENTRRRGSTERGRGATPGIQAAVPGAQREGVEQTLNIRMDGGALRIDQVTNDVRETLRFKLDGSESENDFYPPRSREGFKVKTTSRWEGGQLITEGSGRSDTGQGPVVYTVSEKRYLSEDGQLMIVEQSLQATGVRPVVRKLVYVRQ